VLKTMPTLHQSATQPPQDWHLRPSIGTCVLPDALLQIEDRSAAVARQAFGTDQQAELDSRQAGFEFFWYRLDEAAEDEKFACMAAEIEIRQAAFDFFWCQLGESAEREQFAFMAAELDIRQAAFDFFRQQQDEAEEENKFSLMTAELEIRQAAFDAFWHEVDAATEGQQTVAENAASSSSTYGFIMAGSPAKNLRMLAKGPASVLAVRLGIDDTWSSKLSTHLKFPLDVSGSQDRQKIGCGTTRSSSTSAMALDLGLNMQPKIKNTTLLVSSMGSSRSSSLSALRPVKVGSFGKSGRAMQRLGKEYGKIQLPSRIEFRGWDASSSLRGN